MTEIYEAAERPVPYATAWGVQCPSCGHELAYEVEEDSSGAFGFDPSNWPVCEPCSVMFRPETVEVRVVYDNPLPETSSKEADLPVLTEASLPTTSRLSQLEARTSCAASANYASAPPQLNQDGSSGGETRVRIAQITAAAKSPTETATAIRYEPNLDSPKEGQPDGSVGVPKQLLVYGTPPVKKMVV